MGRRTALIGAVGVVGVLAACGDDTSGDAGADGGAGASDPAATPTSHAPTDAPAATPDETGGAQPLVAAANVPVGSGVIPDGQSVVVTQPVEGEFAAFSTTCTHQGCAVTEVSGDLITCTCHGSQYSVVDGSVRRGPAEQPLAKVPIVVEGGQILPG